ncbi:PREDICTED: oxysterol-binding protein-related protein 1C-like isoform X1 [Ipomoea nil]|uniref:oxysterol-binding protein-related protein 1C-like isoform X1 n=1 Tax=Ipomoea nil TaxID=35883 RepID=UPI00090157D2|nr:PREDICTED: oxysterol-binding protein-related protein 1C-like isoform X1 [Ipomoea nil]
MHPHLCCRTTVAAQNPVAAPPPGPPLASFLNMSPPRSPLAASTPWRRAQLRLRSLSDAHRRSTPQNPLPTVKIKEMVGNGISGILYKWVNYGRGWRPRWFVLQDGVLSYYKIHGPRKIVTNAQTEKGSLVIGQKSFRRINSSKIPSSSKSLRRKPCGEIHLKVSSVRENKSDDRRFSLYTGVKTLHLRTETMEDRISWVEALVAAKEMSPRLPNGELLLMTQMNDNLAVSTEKLRKRLMEEGISEAAIQDSEQIMRSEFAAWHKDLLLLKHKELALVDKVRQLEAEKVDLENTLVDESQRAYDTHFPDKFRAISEGSINESDDDTDRYHAIEEESDDDDDDMFADARDFLSNTAVRAGGNDDGKSSSENDDEGNHPSEGGTSVENKYPCVNRRKKLPDPVEEEKGVSLWSMIKDNIGKDLTKVCLPVYFNEPLSSLQKSFEDFEYSYLLDEAYESGKVGNNLGRILKVAAFAASGYASTDGRHCKPFNPLLGETYEADYPDKGLRFISEKVSHHPMILAFHCEGRGWKLRADCNLKSKFWGRSIQLDPVGILSVEFDDGEVFKWSKVTTSIYNLILGKIYCDHYGTMSIQGNRNHSCRLRFKERSLIDRNPHEVNGVVHNNGKTVATLFGKWDQSIHYCQDDCLGKDKGPVSMLNAQLLWKRSKPSKCKSKYNFTSFAITLNELTPGLKEKLPPTDSRLRPDQRFLENGEYEMANSEKLRLEQRQRQAVKMQESGWKPKWFSKQKDSDMYRYIGGYWEAKEHGNWGTCPNIFGEVSTI